MTSYLEKDVVFKRLSDTRWSAHFDAVHALCRGFDKIKHALDSISGDNEQQVTTRREAEGLSKKMEHLETIFLTILWKDILERMNTTSKVLQSKDVNILVATNLLESLKSYLQETRDKFTDYEFKARSMCPDADYYDGKKRERTRSVRFSRYDRSGEDLLLK